MMVSEVSKPMCQKEMQYVRSDSLYWDWHIEATTYIRQWDS